MAEKNLDENGAYTFEVPAGVFVINVIINGELSGTANITINVGDNLSGQNVITSRELLDAKRERDLE